MDWVQKSISLEFKLEKISRLINLQMYKIYFFFLTPFMAINVTQLVYQKMSIFSIFETFLYTCSLNIIEIYCVCIL